MLEGGEHLLGQEDGEEGDCVEGGERSYVAARRR